jgi:hypothetical protein
MLTFGGSGDGGAAFCSGGWSHAATAAVMTSPTALRQMRMTYSTPRPEAG